MLPARVSFCPRFTHVYGKDCCSARAFDLSTLHVSSSSLLLLPEDATPIPSICPHYASLRPDLLLFLEDATLIPSIYPHYACLRPGLLLFLEDATLSNGCLWARKGSHREPLRQRWERNPAWFDAVAAGASTDGGCADVETASHSTRSAAAQFLLFDGQFWVCMHIPKESAKLTETTPQLVLYPN